MRLAEEQWAEEQRRRANARRRREQPVGEQLLMDDANENDGGEGVDVAAEDHVVVEEEHPVVHHAQPEDAPILGPQERRMRGVAPGERVELAERLNPEVPGPAARPAQPDATGWSDIDLLGAWDCLLHPFSTLSSVPKPLEAKWGKVVEKVLRAVLTAPDEPRLNRALKWLLALPQAFLRQSKRGGQAGRSLVAGRFNAAMEDDFGSVVRLLLQDREREEEARRKRAGQRRREKSEEEIKQLQRKVALSHLQKGEISKAVGRLTSFGVASTEDPAVMASLKSKYIQRGKDLPASVLKGQPVDSLSCLKETLLSLPTGVAAGTGGFHAEYLTSLAEVWDEATMALLEEFSLLYLSGNLPPWWYRVWGTVTTVPLYKTAERVTLRPVGVRNPLIRTLHSRVIRDNRAAFNRVLEPQQLALSLAGGHKLVHQVRRLMEEHKDWVVVKLDVRNAHNEVWRSAVITALESEPTLQHLAWFAAAVIAPETALETGGQRWGDQGDGGTQGDPKESAFFATAIHSAVRQFDADLAVGGGAARFGNDDGYGCGPPLLVFQALTRFETTIRDTCGLTLQREKTEVFAWEELPPGTPPELKRAGLMVEGRFEPGFICYGIPMGTDAYVSKALWDKAEEVKLDLEKVSNILAEDNQALWVALHRSIAHKMDYHLSLCYPTDILPVARHLDSALWSAFELAVGQHVPRQEEGLGLECVVDLPVDNLRGRSFQDHFVRLPIRLRGFGLRSMVDTSPVAFIGGLELAFGGNEEEAGWWRTLLEGGSRTGEEFKASWQLLQREGEQICDFLSVEFEGALARGADNAEGLTEGESSRQEVTEQREELREAMLAKALKQHNDQAARPVRTYPQLDKLSTAWKLSLPGPTNGLSSSVFKEVMAQHLCLPSPACASIVGQRVGAAGVVDPFGDEVMTATLPQDTWRTRHDVFKVEMVNIANEARVPIECEVFGEFRHLIPVQLMEDGGELGFCRQRAGLVPDFKLQLQSPEGPQHCLGELKFISAGVTRYPVGREEKQVDRRARELLI